MTIYQPVLIFKFQCESKDHEKFGDNVVVNMPGELLNSNKVFGNWGWVLALSVFPIEFWDVVYLKIVFHTWNKVTGPCRLPAVVITLLEGGTVGSLFFVREGESGSAYGELCVDILRTETMVNDVEESYMCKRSNVSSRVGRER